MKNRLRTPTILSLLATGGVIATAVAAVKATPKAIEKIKQDSRVKHDGDPYAYTKKEAVQSAWVFYIPTVLIGGSTIMCIFGANHMNRRTQANLTSAYALLNETFRDYQRKLKELYGEEAHNDILRELAVEKAEKRYLYAPGLCSSSSLDFGDTDDLRLFYDTFSNRYFESTVDRVLQAEYHLNRNYVLGAGATVNDFYEFLGIAPLDGGDDLRWYCEDFDAIWIDFNNYRTELDDGLEVRVVEFCFEPREEDEYGY